MIQIKNNTIKRFFSSFFVGFRKIKSSAAYRRSTSVYQIQDIDSDTGVVHLYYRGGHTIVKSSLKEIIHDPAILDGLSSSEACYIGYYHGKLRKEERYQQNLKHLKEKEDGFWLKESSHRFKVVSFDPPDSRLTYLDHISGEIKKENVIVVMRNWFVINNLPPSQACYVGVLAGDIFSKRIEEQVPFEKLKNKPFLRVVKKIYS